MKTQMIRTMLYQSHNWGNNWQTMLDWCNISKPGGKGSTLLVWGMNIQNVQIGDVMLIHDDGPRLHWRLSVIDSLIQGNDGFVWLVNVHTINRVMSRPISRLYPSEISYPPTDHNNSKQSSTTEPMIYNNDSEISKERSSKEGKKPFGGVDSPTISPPGGCRELDTIV